MEDVWSDGACLVGGLPTRIPGNSVCTTFYLSTLILIFREEEEDNFKKFWRGYIYQRCKNFFQTASLPPCLHPTELARYYRWFTRPKVSPLAAPTDGSLESSFARVGWRIFGLMEDVW